MKQSNLKAIGIFFVILIVLSTAAFCFVKPDMHKPFEISVIEYLLKIDTNGNAVINKEITTTKVEVK